MKKNYKLIILIALMSLPLFLSARHNARVKPYPERKIFSYEIQGDTHWLGMGKGIVKYDAVTDSVLHITEAVGYELGIVKDIAVADSNLVWFVVNDSLLLTYGGDKWENKTVDLNVISTGTLGHITLDEIGILWLVKGQYLLKYYNNTWEVESDSLPLKVEVTDIIKNAGNIWVSTMKGVAVFSEGSWVTKSLNCNHSGYSFRFVSNKEDELFSIFTGGIYKFEIKDEIVMEKIMEYENDEHESYTEYLSLFYNYSNKLIVSYANGDDFRDYIYVHIYDTVLSNIPGLSHYNVRANPPLFQEEQKNLWIAIQDELHRYNYNSKKTEKIKLWRGVLDELLNDIGEYVDLKEEYGGPKIRGNGNMVFEQEEGLWHYCTLDYYDNNDPEPIPLKEGNFVNGLREGVWDNYNYNGEFINSDTYKNGYREGEVLFYNKNNVVITRGNYLKNKKHGRWDEYSYEGDLVAFKQYENDLMHGSYTKVFNNGCYKLALYERGELVQDWKTYNKNGIEIYSEINPNLIKPPLLKDGEKKNGIRMRMLDQHFQPTDLYTEARYYRSVRYENGTLVTKAREYLLDGTLCIEGEVLSEEPIRFNGKVNHFNRDGEIIGQSYYVNGKKEGKCITLITSSYQETRKFEDAEYYRIANYKNGKPKGIVRDYYMDGSLQFEGKLLSGFPSIYDGTIKFYYSNGKLRKKAKYKDVKQINVKHYKNED